MNHKSYAESLEQDGISIDADLSGAFIKFLTPDALKFIAALARKAEKQRQFLLEKRKQRQNEINNGAQLNFLKETKNIRDDNWKIKNIPSDLLDRRVEITGPVDRKMVINALNSGAKTFMADFEDSHSPTWDATIQGQINLYDAVRRTISFTSPEGKSYKLNTNPAILIVRPRGWHLNEKHVFIDGKEISASIFDFGLYFFYNAAELIKNNTGPYFYLPKMQSHLEARLWNDIFIQAQELLNISYGTIKATVLIETIHAAFEMDEILYELRDHCVGLNCGRWDYIFSMIKTFSNHKDHIYPDRNSITMTTPFMHNYSLLTIKTCHRRGAQAMGGMAAQIPIKADPIANEAAIKKVSLDKIREAKDGHDGTWVAHPGLVNVALSAFDEFMPKANQIDKQLNTLEVPATDLLLLPKGDITKEGLRSNINITIQYLAHWLSGNGCVPLYHLMEDAATAEISRSQVWQWLHHNAVLNDGQKITTEMISKIFNEELNKIRQSITDEEFNDGHYQQASDLAYATIVNPEFDEFLTLKAYKFLS